MPNGGEMLSLKTKDFNIHWCPLLGIHFSLEKRKTTLGPLKQTLFSNIGHLLGHYPLCIGEYIFKILPKCLSF